MPERLTGKCDVYIEIANRYERYITLGVLRDGDKLPSVRAAAGELGVNPNTVQKAYSYLESKGLICTLPKKGVFVIAPAEPKVNEKRQDILKTIDEYRAQGVSYYDMINYVKEIYAND